MHLKGHLLLPLPAAVMSIGCQVSIFLENSRESTLNLREGQLKKKSEPNLRGHMDLYSAAQRTLHCDVVAITRITTRAILTISSLWACFLVGQT